MPGGQRQWPKKSSASPNKRRKLAAPPDEKSWPPGLFDKFPNEILLYIAGKLLEDDAMALAKVDSRRYHLLISQVYRENVRDNGGDALLWGATWQSIATVKRALAAGADANAHITMRPGRRPMAMYRRDRNKRPFPAHSPHRNTPLREAAMKGSADTVRVLLDAGAQLTDGGHEEHGTHQPLSALFGAAASGNLEVLQLLLTVKGADINVKGQNGDGLLVSAVRSGSIAMAEYVFNNLQEPLTNASDSCSLLEHAVTYTRREVLQYLLDTGKFDVNQAGSASGSTPLMAAAGSGAAEMLRVLLRQPGIDVNIEDSRGRPAITRAIEANERECAYILLQHPDAGVPTFTVFETACKRRMMMVVDTLLRSKQTPKSLCRLSGRTWMHVAAQYNLATAITALNRVDKTMLNAQCISGNTPLAEAARDRHCRETFKKLLRFKPDLELANDRGETPLHVSCRNGNVYQVTDLVERGANVHAKNIQGQTPLHLACCSGDNIGIVRMLIRAGASVQETDSNGKSPLEMASGSEFEEIVSEMCMELSHAEAGGL